MADKEKSLAAEMIAWFQNGDGRFIFSKKDCDCVVKALTKQVPMKPYKSIYPANTPFKTLKTPTCHCPACGRRLAAVTYFCGNCGQALDWEAEK